MTPPAVPAGNGLPLNRWTHARSYVGFLPANFAHRARLARLRSLLRRLDLPKQGLLIDLGCSDGFILSELRRHGDLPDRWRMAGYDKRRRLVRLARRRDLPATRFGVTDLNDANARVGRPGRVVICLETLEHVGDYRAALRVIHAALRPGGYLILSMPNEVGVVGLIKLLCRPLTRLRPYRSFFTGTRQLVRYIIAVATYRDLESFRWPPRVGWGPHLGFDHRAVMRHLQRDFFDTGLWTVDRVERSAFGANQFLVARRAMVPSSSDG